MTLDEVRRGLRAARYIPTPRVETALFLALTLEKPLLAEGPAGAGKTELGKVLAEMLGTDLVRLQCYEGLDEARALFEWNYQKQLLRIQADRAEGRSWEDLSSHIFSADFLLERPLLRAIVAPRRVVLLIDEVDKADPEFEAFLLEVLSDFQITVPELGTIRARERPSSSSRRTAPGSCPRRSSAAACTSSSTSRGGEGSRDHRAQGPRRRRELRAQIARFVGALRKLDLRKAPSIAETLDWARGLCALGVRELDPAAVRQTLSLVVKHEEDLRKAEGKVGALLAGR
jgi:MoxR-like ATPase